jgi:hypothetical protein
MISANRGCALISGQTCGSLLDAHCLCSSGVVQA